MTYDVIGKHADLGLGSRILGSSKKTMSTSAGGDSGEEDSEELALFRQQWRQELGIIPNPPPSHAEPEEEVIYSKRHITAHNISSASYSVHPFTNCDDSVWYYVTIITVLIAATGIVTRIRWTYGLWCGCGLPYL